MKRPFFLILIYVLLFVSQVAVCQNQSIDQGGTRLEVRLFSEDQAKVNVEGSPYLVDNFLEAKINDRSETYLVRYNAEEEQMELKVADAKVVVLDNSTVDYTITFSSPQMVYKTVDYGAGGRGYAVLLWENERCAVYKREKVQFNSARVASSSYQEDKSAAYVRLKDMYYFKGSGNDILQEIPTKKKQFYSLFDNPEIQKYAEKEKLSYKDINDIIKIVGFYCNE